MSRPTPVPPAGRVRGWALGATAVLLVAVGLFVSTQVGAALGLAAADKDVPGESATAAASRPELPPPDYRLVVIPDDPALDLAGRTVAAAIRAAGGPAAVVRHDQYGRGPVVTATIDASIEGSDEAYKVHRRGQDLEVSGASANGAATGLYAVADRIRSGRVIIPPRTDGKAQQPRLELRLTDMGSVGISADEAAFRAGTDYSLNTSVVGTALLADRPYVDAAAVDRIARQFRHFVDHSLAQGYNGVVIPGFLEYVTFAGVSDGDSVYPADDPRRDRAEAMVRAFRPVWRYAHDMGMKVYFSTDMLALSPPLQDYLQSQFGGLTVEDPQFWDVYSATASELFDRMQFADGLMVRIGEGGDIYKLPGWEFTSQIAVKTPAAVQQMLTSLLGAAENHGKSIIFRSWTVGVGSVGDLHTSTAKYEEVLGGIDAPNLIVSTKFTAGDFYSHLPLNPTLDIGDQKRIVEFQARREFEGFGSLPNDLGPLTKQALDHFLAANPHVMGVWNWTQDGGPLRAGPMILHLREGFWQLADLNSYQTARLAADPAADPAEITVDWARQTFSDDPKTVAAISGAMARSREAITKGLYIGPFADQSVKALGLEPPPMMWLFEWDILTGDSSVWDSIYTFSKDRLDESVAEAGEAATAAKQMKDDIAGTDPSAWRDPGQRQEFLDTLDYQISLSETLGSYRELMLRHVQWLDTGDPSAEAAQVSARARYQAARDHHVATYGGNIALPAYNFTAADLGLQRADRDELMAWLARGLFVLIGAVLLLGTATGQRLLRGGRLPGAAAVRGLWIGCTRPWRIGDLDVSPGRTDRVLVWVLPVIALGASRSILTWFAAPAHLLATLGAWAIFLAILRWRIRGFDAFWLWAGVGGAILLRTMLLLVALMRRGPGRYWLHFWTDPTMRTLYIAVAFAAFLWVFAVAAFVLHQRYGVQWRGTVGRVLLALGTPLLLLGGLVQVLGLESALTTWNDQMALLPWGLSRILGITVYLGIPDVLPLIAGVAGAVLAVAGFLLAIGTAPRLAARDSATG